MIVFEIFEVFYFCIPLFILLKFGYMKKRILIIDDDLDLADLLTRFLQSKEFETAHALNGKEGLERLVLFHPDLILLDVEMPVMNGFEFLKVFRKNPEYNLIPVIVLSGINDNANIVKALQLGAENFINKPFSLPVALWHIKNTFRITNQYASVNVLTGLPENPQIQQEINHLIHNNIDFTLLSIEIKEYRVFNRYYDFIKGKDILALTASLLKKFFRDDFIGHPEEAVFVVITRRRDYSEPLGKVMSSFEKRKLDFYDPVVAAQKHLDIIDRVGNMTEHPLITLSTGVVPMKEKHYSNAEEVLEVALEVRLKAKSNSESSIYTDKRVTFLGRYKDQPRLKVIAFEPTRHLMRTVLHFLTPLEAVVFPVKDIDELIEIQKTQEISAIFIDLELGELSGTLQDIRYYERKNNLPHSFITILTPVVSQQEVVHFIKAGASNIITSPITKDMVFHNYKKIIQSLRR